MKVLAKSNAQKLYGENPYDVEEYGNNDFWINLNWETTDDEFWRYLGKTNFTLIAEREK